MTEFFNRDTERDLRRRLRKEMPKAEVLLWCKLQRRQLLGKRFRRQYSAGPYCIDFYCPEARLAIEVDGESHYTPDATRHDQERQRFIETFGFQFLRFTNVEVYDNLDGVLETIAALLRKTPPS